MLSFIEAVKKVTSKEKDKYELMNQIEAFTRKLDALVQGRKARREQAAKLAARTGKRRIENEGNEEDGDDHKNLNPEAQRIKDIDDEVLELIKANEQRVHRRVRQRFTSQLILAHLHRYVLPKIRVRMQYYK